MIVTKAVNMAKMMDIPILGLVENMSYATCPDCDKKIYVFGESHLEDIARENNIKTTARLPIDPKIASACDTGMIELFEGDWLDGLAEVLAETQNEKQ